MTNGKLSEQVLDEMIFACKGMIDAANDLKALLVNERAPEKPSCKPLFEAKTADHEDPPKTYTFQEIRGIMASLSGSGKKAEAKALLGKYGASRLSEVAESDYAALAKDAEVIADE